MVVRSHFTKKVGKGAGWADERGSSMGTPGDEAFGVSGLGGSGMEGGYSREVLETKGQNFAARKVWRTKTVRVII
jgi:hypothetical protein